MFGDVYGNSYISSHNLNLNRIINNNNNHIQKTLQLQTTFNIYLQDILIQHRTFANSASLY